MLLRSDQEQQNVDTRGNISRKRRGGLLVGDFEVSGSLAQGCVRCDGGVNIANCECDYEQGSGL